MRDENNIQEASCSTSTFSRNDESLSYSNLILGGDVVEVPTILLNDESIFRSVLSEKSFLSLSETSREHIMQFLPISKEVDRKTAEDLLKCVFTSENFCFGNPLKIFYAKIRGGYFSSTSQVQLRDHKRVLYDHYIRHYYMNLLKKLLINRSVTLENALKFNATEPILINPRNFISEKKVAKLENIRKRARIRARRMINECKIKAGEHAGASSEESSTENDTHSATSDTRSTMFMDKFSSDLDLYQPAMKMKNIDELYRDYHYLRETEPDCPSLDISDITLEDVYERAGISFQAEKNFSKISEQNFSQMICNRKSAKQKGDA